MKRDAWQQSLLQIYPIYWNFLFIFSVYYENVFRCLLYDRSGQLYSHNIEHCLDAQILVSMKLWIVGL